MTVDESDAFEFDFSELETPAVAATRHVSVESGRQRSVLFPIKPLVLGEILLSVRATSSTASEFVRRTLLVKVQHTQDVHTRSVGCI